MNTALRVRDILSLKWESVYDFDKETFRERLETKEKKTGKYQDIALNNSIVLALSMLFEEKKPGAEDFIFPGRGGNALSRYQAFRIIKNAAQELSLGDHISCHSLRKTFGYHAYKMGISPALLMEIFNHSSYSTTKRYLGLNQDEKDEVFRKINL